MPRRTKLRRHSDGWNPEHIRILKTGGDFFSEFRDEIDMHKAWQDLRAEIMAEWIIEFPGTRCFGWWRFDMPENSRRERIDGGVHPYDDHTNDLPRKWYYGKPGYLRSCDMQARYESQEAYLRRLNLCSAAELKALSERLSYENSNTEK